VVALTNAIDGPARELAVGIVKLVDSALDSSKTPDDTEAAAAADLASYTGHFAALWGLTDVVDLGGRLWLVAPNQPDPTVAMEKLEIVDADTLRIAEAGGYSSPGETVRYTRSDGRVTSVLLGGTSVIPIEDHVRVLRVLDRIVLGGPHVLG
jgi:hypothetical protein